MPLIIKYVSQPNAGEELTIPDDLPEIRFGRGLEAEIGFPAELDIVSRDHFRLRRELGAYKFVISRDRPVYSRGRAILDGEELDKVAEVQLSGPSGPRLRIERTGEKGGEFAKTRILKGGRDIGDFAEATTTGRRRLGQWLGAVTLVIAAVAGGYVLLQQDVSDLRAEIPSLSEQMAKANAAAAGRVNAAAIIAKNKESVYQIQLQMPTGTVLGTGTASVVMLPDGTKALATNAHVAEMFLDVQGDPAMAGMKLVAVQPKGPDYPQLEITGVKLHPAYGPLNEAIERILRKIVALAAQDVKPMIGFDVALMYVADSSKLGEPLIYASREKLLAMRPGDPLLLVGYAGEGLRGTDEKRPEPTSQAGIVTSLTTFYLYHGADADNLLVQHSLPAAGGASGSPMFNADGEVVALINAVNVADVASSGARITSAALVNYAQRADMLFDLIDGQAEAKMPEYRQQMAEAEARLTKTPDQIVADLVSMFGMEIGDQSSVQQLTVLDAVMDQKLTGSANGLYAARTQTLDAGKAYMMIAIAEDQRPIAMLGLDAGQNTVVSGPGTSFVSFLFFDNRQLKLPQILFVAVDASSLGSTAVTPGKVKIYLYQAQPKGGS